MSEQEAREYREAYSEDAQTEGLVPFTHWTDKLAAAFAAHQTAAKYKEIARLKAKADQFQEQYIILRKGWDSGALVPSDRAQEDFWKIQFRTVPFRSPSERALKEIARLKAQLLSVERETVERCAMAMCHWCREGAPLMPGNAHHEINRPDANVPDLYPSMDKVRVIECNAYTIRALAPAEGKEAPSYRPSHVIMGGGWCSKHSQYASKCTECLAPVTAPEPEAGGGER